MKKLFAVILLSTLCLFVSQRRVHAQSFSFGAAGDFANGSAFQATVQQVKANNPSFMIALGDLAYSTVEQAWCNTWKNNFSNIVLIAGNHDSGESSAGNINTYAQYCPYPLNSPMTGTYGKQYYFDYPAANPIARFILVSPGLGGSFIGLDTNYSIGHQGYIFTANAIDDARAKGIKWVFVAEHKNYISIMEKSNELGPDFTKMLIDKRVDVLLQGHEHGYERSKQLTCAKAGSFDPTCVADGSNALVKGAGTVIHVIGTGGQGLRGLNRSDSENSYFASADNTTNGFGKFTVSATQLSYNFIRSAGGNFSDSFTISGSGSGPIPTQIPTQSPVVQPSRLPTSTPVPGVPTAMSSPLPTTVPSCGITVSGRSSVSMTTGSVIAGSYAIWTRMMSSGDLSNAYYLQVDNTCPINVGDNPNMPTNSWEWVNYSNGSSANRIIIQLGAGTHTITLANKEDNLKIDKVLLLADVLCTPTGLGDNCNVPTITPIITQQPVPSTVKPTEPTNPTGVNPTRIPSDDDDDDTSNIPTSQAGLIPTHDATVKESSPKGNYKADTTLEVSGGSKKEAYIKFDLEKISKSSIHTAKLRFTVAEGSLATQDIYFINNTSWGERIITWDTRPNVARQKIAEMHGGNTGSVVEVNLTEFIKSRAGKVTSIVIAQNGSDSFSVRSKESPSGKPMLVIN